MSIILPDIRRESSAEEIREAFSVAEAIQPHLAAEDPVNRDRVRQHEHRRLLLAGPLATWPIRKRLLAVLPIRSVPRYTAIQATNRSTFEMGNKRTSACRDGIAPRGLE